MKEGRLEIFISIGVHLSFIALLMVSSFPVQNRPVSVVEVDFSLAKDPLNKVGPNVAPKMVQTRPLFLRNERGIVVQDQPVQENSAAISMNEQAAPSPVPAIVKASSTPDEMDIGTMAAPRATVACGLAARDAEDDRSGGTPPVLHGSAGGQEAIRSRAAEQSRESLAEGSENFNYIRDAVMKNIRYPDRARRLGFEGKVLLSFIVLENGTTSEIRVIQGSCYRILDESAKEAVAETHMTRTVPYRIVVRLPITYKLQGAKDGRT
jgi:periplasmic protein TonB